MSIYEGWRVMKHLPVDLTTAVATSRVEDLLSQAERYRMSARARRAARRRLTETRSHSRHSDE